MPLARKGVKHLDFQSCGWSEISRVAGTYEGSYLSGEAQRTPSLHWKTSAQHGFADIPQAAIAPCPQSSKPKTRNIWGSLRRRSHEPEVSQNN